MLIRQPEDILPSEITPPKIYRERRRFMQGMGALAAGAALGAAPDVLAGAKLAGVRASAYKLDDDSTPYRDVTTYNNFLSSAPARVTRPKTQAA
jgi:methionine sulfoxide reductase catalytic subunit